MVLVQNVVASAAIVLLVILSRSVECVSNSKTTSSPSSNDGVKDLKTDGTSFWSPQPEYYHERDRYSRPDRTDFVTSYGGSNENKYGGSTTASYGSKDRFGYGPFSTTGSGGSAYFTSGGIYDRNKPLHYGPPQPVEYTHTDYDGHYDYNSPGHGYSLGHPYGSGKDIAKSVLIPLAGAALLGIAAALVANPVLLHLGVAAGKKRKRRDVMANAHNLAYRAQLRKPPT